ncbi:MAG: RNA-binding S4 domain-containing protein [Ruminococcaceae bacterium]|nr:RNA-binding S4 domain-containing protein [Oscillospiraceae bacterium]
MKITVKVKKKEEKDVFITTENIPLDKALKFSGIAGTGGQAKMLIQDGLVRVNGEVCLSRGKKLKAGDCFEFSNVIYGIKSK